MNIIVENNRADGTVRAHSNADRVTAKDRSTSAGKTSAGAAFALDISGKVTDNTAYGGHGKTAEDVMQEAGQIDTAVQKNYMTVMSNAMSDEDFAKLQEEGHYPGDMEIEEVVTIVDEIKAALLKGGKNIEGYTDDLDKETLQKIMGSEALADEVLKQFQKYDIPVTEENAVNVKKACDKAAQLNEINDGVIKYMVSNEMEPTIDNIYRAEYSTAADADRQGKGYYQDDTGYYAKKAEDFDWDKLKPQMEKVIESAGLEITDKTISDAKWLVEKGIPLTKESISSLYHLNNAQIPSGEKESAATAAAAIADGKQAGAGDLSDGRTHLEKAARYVEDANSVSGEAADLVLAEGGVLNLKNLKSAQNKIAQGKAEAYEGNPSGRLVLEEVRLKMTVEANLRLLKTGFSIDTAELEQLVDALKQAQEERSRILFGNNGKAEKLYNDTLFKINEIPFMPVSLIGKFMAQNTEPDLFTVNVVYEEGKNLQNIYQKAGESYETLMTEPRADMGDSIKKAFRNIDNLLENSGMEPTEENRRAARILGYNRMEISKENVDEVKSADMSIRRVINKMTPGAAMRMIRDGVNPLSMNMEELEAYLDAQNMEPSKELEKYSEYLYKLEKNNGITEEERDTFIGIYRLFRQLDKTDGAAIGTLVNQGVQPSMKNLLSAMRSSKKRGMDIKADEQFGGISALSSGKTKKISEQIESSYFGKLSSEVYDNLDGGIMTSKMAEPELLPEELLNMLRKEPQSSKTEDSYTRQQAKSLRESGTADDSVIKELLEFKQPVTANNLLAAGLLRKERGKLAERIREIAYDMDDPEMENGKKYDAAVEHLQESLTNKEEARNAYEELQKTFSGILEEAVYGQQEKGRIDLKEISGLYKRLSLTGNLAKEENYEVPVEAGGIITSINLKIIHESGENGKVTASMQTEKYGELSAQFTASGENRLSGYIVCDRAETLQMLKESGNELKKELEQSDILITSLDFIFGKESDAVSRQKDRSSLEDSGAEDGISTGKLYEAAKAFIGYIQKGEGWNYEDSL